MRGSEEDGRLSAVREALERLADMDEGALYLFFTSHIYQQYKKFLETLRDYLTRCLLATDIGEKPVRGEWYRAQIHLLQRLINFETEVYDLLHRKGRKKTEEDESFVSEV